MRLNSYTHFADLVAFALPYGLRIFLVVCCLRILSAGIFRLIVFPEFEAVSHCGSALLRPGGLLRPPPRWFD